MISRLLTISAVAVCSAIASAQGTPAPKAAKAPKPAKTPKAKKPPPPPPPPPPKPAKAPKAKKPPPPPPKPAKAKKPAGPPPPPPRVPNSVREMVKCRKLFIKLNITSEAELKKYIIAQHPDKGNYELDSKEADEYKEISNCYTLIKALDEDVKERVVKALFQA